VPPVAVHHQAVPAVGFSQLPTPREVACIVTTKGDLLGRSFAEERYRAMLESLFGALAGLLAAVGTYGVTARAVAPRESE
jgi:hypothetical protein